MAGGAMGEAVAITLSTSAPEGRRMDAAVELPCDTVALVGRAG